jgi:hypothetical protein
VHVLSPQPVDKLQKSKLQFLENKLENKQFPAKQAAKHLLGPALSVTKLV